MPVSASAASTTISVQVPFASLPSKVESGASGRNDPVNGALPAAIS
ncbi:MAG: hypothetical protein QOF69_3469, partial [Solirubrobacteraceae bacterium]|nr:hypothetical protein [Solirubrobacteraceae bacterium]